MELKDVLIVILFKGMCYLVTDHLICSFIDWMMRVVDSLWSYPLNHIDHL